MPDSDDGAAPSRTDGDKHMGSCSEAEATKAMECGAKITATEGCEMMKQQAACVPKCMITDATQKEAEASWKAAGCSGDVPKIGSAAGIRASAFTVFVSAAVALVASR